MLSLVYLIPPPDKNRIVPAHAVDYTSKEKGFLQKKKKKVKNINTTPASSTHQNIPKNRRDFLRGNSSDQNMTILHLDDATPVGMSISIAQQQARANVKGEGGSLLRLRRRPAASDNRFILCVQVCVIS